VIKVIIDTIRTSGIISFKNILGGFTKDILGNKDK